MNTTIRLRDIACLLAVMSSFSIYAVPLPVVVKTWGEHRAGNIVYYHEVTNNSRRSIGTIDVGLDTDVTEHFPENGTREVGELNFILPINSGTGVDGEPDMNPAAVSGPAGWTAKLIPMEGGGMFLTWYRPAYPGGALTSGQTYRFSVTVPGKIDDDFLIRNFSVRLSELSEPPSGAAYLSGHFSMHFTDVGHPLIYNGQMELIDKAAPSLSVTLTPSQFQENDKLMPIVATLTVKDDYDPQPEIRLESITANEVVEAGDIRGALYGQDVRRFSLKADIEREALPSRIYTITYSATDASGNKATASATVTVKREERRYKESHKEGR